MLPELHTKLLAKMDCLMPLNSIITGPEFRSEMQMASINNIFLFQCAAGVAYETPCQKGLSYAPEAHLCDYPDNIYDCKGLSETVVGFKCPSPEELPPNAVARR